MSAGRGKSVGCAPEKSKRKEITPESQSQKKTLHPAENFTQVSTGRLKDSATLGKNAACFPP